MLNNEEAHFARQNGLDPEKLQSIDPESGRVVMLDGSEHQICQVITRCMGYHRPVSFWNKGKQAEHATRTAFDEAKAMRHVEEASRMVA